MKHTSMESQEPYLYAGIIGIEIRQVFPTNTAILRRSFKTRKCIFSDLTSPFFPIHLSAHGTQQPSLRLHLKLTEDSVNQEPLTH